VIGSIKNIFAAILLIVIEIPDLVIHITEKKIAIPCKLEEGDHTSTNSVTQSSEASLHLERARE
jgi:hypothetical protein